MALIPSQTPRKLNRKKTQPERAKACVPESRTPIVQPSAVIEPQPRRIPPISDAIEFLKVSFESLNLPPASAAANDAPIIPIASQPLLVIVSETTAIHPAMRSRPRIESGPIFLFSMKVLAEVLSWRVTPSGSTRRYAKVPTIPTRAPVVIGLQRSEITFL